MKRETFNELLIGLLNSANEEELNCGIVVHYLAYHLSGITLSNFGDTQEARDKLKEIFDEAWKYAKEELN